MGTIRDMKSLQKMAQKTVYQFQWNTLQGKPFDMETIKGKVVLFVNTASKCGLTPQYKGLEDLYKKYREKGFVILGFPCNQFAGQEPGTESEITEFCQRNYGVSFPMMEKINVNGSDAHPLYEFMKKEKPGIMGIQLIKWNFEKLLVNKQGQVVERFAPTTEPKALESYIEKLLQ